MFRNFSDYFSAFSSVSTLESPEAYVLNNAGLEGSERLYPWDKSGDDFYSTVVEERGAEEVVELTEAGTAVEAGISAAEIIPVAIGINAFNQASLNNMKELEDQGLGLAGHTPMVGMQEAIETSYYSNSSLIETGLVAAGALTAGPEGLAVGAAGAALYGAFSQPDQLQIQNDNGGMSVVTNLG